MRRLVWVLGWLAVAVWSLVAWGSYGLLNVFGDVAARNADLVTGNPEGVELISWALGALQGLGLTAIVVVWALVSLVILAATAVLARVLGALRGNAGGPPYGRGYEPAYPPHRPRTGGLPFAVQELMRRIDRR
ncbi:MAG TPA: hypothetical protein VGU45_15275 [Microvirga sp.]|jgi:small-conductance mechanosensitive channel|nr:hypothetical protein [Microvirga sp.]